MFEKKKAAFKFCLKHQVTIGRKTFIKPVISTRIFSAWKDFLISFLRCFAKEIGALLFHIYVVIYKQPIHIKTFS